MYFDINWIEKIKMHNKSFFLCHSIRWIFVSIGNVFMVFLCGFKLMMGSSLEKLRRSSKSHLIKCFRNHIGFVKLTLHNFSELSLFSLMQSFSKHFDKFSAINTSTLITHISHFNLSLWWCKCLVCMFSENSWAFLSSQSNKGGKYIDTLCKFPFEVVMELWIQLQTASHHFTCQVKSFGKIAWLSFSLFQWKNHYSKFQSSFHNSTASFVIETFLAW